jgi:hypothetical protein
MRLPGSRYQEHGWEHVRKLLGHCSLQALVHAHLDSPLASPLASLGDLTLADYIDSMADLLRVAGQSQRACQPGNSYGDSVHELALSLLYELQDRPSEWAALLSAVAAEQARQGAFWERTGGEAILRKKINDMFAVLRDKVDADNYQAACGRECSANKMYAYRMVDTAHGEIARIFAAWREHAPQVAAILGRAVEAHAEPIETRQLKSILDCKAEWVLRWSESRERFTGSPGPLHTRSKRFASLKDKPDKIAAILREIGEYELLSANRDSDWQQDAGEASLWLDDLARVFAQSEAAASTDDDQILPAASDSFDAGEPEPVPLDDTPDPAWPVLAQSVSLPPRYMQLAEAAQDPASWSLRMMMNDSLPVRLAVYLKMLGPIDDSYPSEWLDPATGALPTMQQLAVLDQLSLPTLRKRRDAAITRLQTAARP